MQNDQYPQYPQHSQPPQYPEYPRRHGIPVLKIIGTILLVLIIICGGLVTWVAYNFRSWAGSFARGPLVTMVDEFKLPDDQKTSIKQNIARVADAFEEGRLSWTEFQTILEKLSKGPFFDLMMVEAMRHQYGIAHPQMDAERAETMLLFDRFARGIVEGSIAPQKVRKVMSLAHDPDQPHDGGVDNKVTESDLEPFITAMHKEVEAANIPAEPFTPDFAAEIDKALNSVMGSTATQSAADQESEPPATTLPANLPAETMPSQTAPAQSVSVEVN